MKSALKRFLGGSYGNHDFESSGNYVFRISKREMEKVALGLNFRTVAFRGLNDAYFSGVEFEKLADNGPTKKKVKALIGLNNLLCKIGIANHGILAAVIFKNTPCITLQKKLKDSGFKIVHLPKNPYISG